MSPDSSQTVIAIYRVRADKEPEFVELLRRHHPALLAAGLVTEERPIVYRGQEKGGGPIVFEIFHWRDGEAPGVAHGLPEIQEIWGPMGDLCEEREGKPRFEFPHVEPLELPEA